MINFKYRKYKCVLLVIIMIFSISSLAFAESSLSGDQVVVKGGKIIKGPAFYSGNMVKIDGSIDGTTFAAGKDVIINGIIIGDLFVAAQNVTINGKVYGNVFTAGQNVSIGGNVFDDVFVAGDKFVITKDAVLKRDLLMAATSGKISGNVLRQVFSATSEMTIDGKIYDDAKFKVGDLQINDGAFIQGNLDYEGVNQAAISENAKIKGKTNWKKTLPPQKAGQYDYADAFLSLIYSLLTALSLWFALILWRPRFWDRTIVALIERPGYTLGIGALTLVVTPIFAFILMLSMIGLPLAIGIAFAYAFSLYLSKIIVAVFIGSWLAQKYSWPALHKGLWLALLGLAIIEFLAKIPIIESISVIFTILLGLGAVVLTFAKPSNI